MDLNNLNFMDSLRTKIDDPKKSLEQIRLYLINKLIIIGVILGFPAIVMAIVEAIYFQQYLPMIVYIITYLPLLLVSLKMHDFSYNIKTSVLFAGIYIIASHNFFTWGVSGASIPLIVLLSVLVSVFYGIRKGIISLVLSLLPLFIAGFLMINGYLSPTLNINTISTNTVSWITAAFVLILASSISVISSGILQSNLKRSLEYIKQQAQELSDKNIRLQEDIKKRKLTEKALKESESRFRSLFENLGAAVFVTNLEEGSIGNILEVNLEAEKQTGYSRDELLSMNIVQDISVQNNSYKSFEAMKNSSAKTKKIETTEKKIKKDGKEYWTEVILTPIYFKGKKAALSINHDITDRIHAETEKQHLQKQLMQTQKLESIGTLAGGVAHDFNNILTVIMGLSQLLLNQTDQENPKYTKLNNIYDSSKRAAKLTKQLLLFSRKQDMQFEVVDINDIIFRLNKMLKRLIGEDISMHLNFNNNLWSINADENQIEQVITNLVVNARDAMPEGGELTVSTQNIIIDKEKAQTIPDIKPGKYVQINVEDTGTGIAKSIQSQIFDPFFTTKGRAEGTGMGLSVVHGIVKKHGGIINVYSEPGEGTVFKIYLPAVKKQRQKRENAKVTESFEQYRGKGETVLVVEDEEPVLTYLENILATYGYNYISSKSGEEAIKLFRNNKANIDLLISDVIMTGMDGVELADKLKSEKEDLGVILSSGYSDKKISRNTIKNKEYKFIQKPYDILKLLKLMKATL